MVHDLVALLDATYSVSIRDAPKFLPSIFDVKRGPYQGSQKELAHLHGLCTAAHLELYVYGLGARLHAAADP